MYEYEDTPYKMRQLLAHAKTVEATDQRTHRDRRNDPNVQLT